MKVLAKLGLVTAAAATVLFIFIYEFQGPVINRVMTQAPPPPAPVETIEQPEAAVEIESNIDENNILPAQVDPVDEVAAETEINTESEQPSISEEVAPEEPVAVEEPAGPTRNIYGKITLSTTGEQLGGVNIMIPGSTVAKVSNSNGGYTIEVPENTRELVFIYRGKKLVHRINTSENLINVVLDLETMQYD